jgi:hypothetical protein
VIGTGPTELECANQAADHDTEPDPDHARHVGGAVCITQCRDGAIGVGTRPDDAKDVASIEFSAARTARRRPCESGASMTPRELATPFAQGPTVEVLP